MSARCAVHDYIVSVFVAHGSAALRGSIIFVGVRGWCAVGCFKFKRVRLLVALVCAFAGGICHSATVVVVVRLLLLFFIVSHGLLCGFGLFVVFCLRLFVCRARAQEN